MIELIYLEEAEPQEPVREAILQEFPGATFEDASDFVHANRLQVEIPGEGGEEAERAFFRLAAREGFALCCLGIQLSLRKGKAWVREELDRLRAARQQAPEEK